MAQFHLMSDSVPEDARDKLHLLVCEHLDLPLRPQVINLTDLMERLETAVTLEGVNPLDAFEGITGIRPQAAPAFSYTLPDDPDNNFKVRHFAPHRFVVRNSGWWVNPHSTLQEAVELVAA